MCFSATASFTASAALGVVGAITLGKTKNRRAWPLSAVPLLFALQQFTEGLLWVSFDRWPNYVLPLTHVFLFFALLLWPVYTPLMMYFIETQKWRRIVIAVFCVAGATVGLTYYSNFLADPQSASVVGKCIYYPRAVFHPDLMKYLYILVTVGSGLVSSRMIAKVFCALVLIGSLFTYFFYTVTFTSVWCFFAAAISAVLVFHPQRS